MFRILKLAFLALAIAGPADAQDLKEVIQKHLAWRGPAYVQTDSIGLEGAVEAGGLTGTMESWQDRSGHSFDKLDLGPLKVSTAVGAKAWEQRDGVVETMGAETVEDAKHRAALEFASAFDPKSARLIGTETRDGRVWTVVRLFPGADVYEAFIDASSGELLGFRIVEDRRPRFVTLSDWRMVDGVRMAFLREESGEIATDFTRVRVTKVALNQPPAPGAFARPQGRRIASFDGGKTTTGPLAFDFFRGNRIYIPAKVNGAEVNVLLDSGAETSVLDKTWADAHGIRGEGKVTALGTGGTAEASFAHDVSFRIGDLTLQNLNVAILDLSGIARQLGAPLPVILGAEVFKQLIVDVDFEAKQIAFHDPAGFKPPKGAAVVPVTSTSGKIRSVPISIEGGPPVQVDFDIGNGSPFLISSAYWEPRNMLDARVNSKTLSGAVGGMREQPIASLKTLTFAGVTFRDVPTVFQTAGRTAVDSDRSVGNVGLPILSRFRMMTDYPNDRLYLVAHKDAAKAPFLRNRAGLRTIRNSAGMLVVHVASGSPAAQAGFKPDDLIIAIDGKPFDASSEQWQTGPAGTKVALTMSDTTVRTITLKDYY